MTVTVELLRWVHENFDWQTKIGRPLVRMTAPRHYLVTIETEGASITVNKEELRAALNALDQERK